MRQTLEMALEALEDIKDDCSGCKFEWSNDYPLQAKAHAAIKKALAQAEQEPVSKFAKFTDGIWREVTDGSAGVPLYTAPQRTWVGLTDEEIKELDLSNYVQVVRIVEAKLKDKNL